MNKTLIKKLTILGILVSGIVLGEVNDITQVTANADEVSSEINKEERISINVATFDQFKAALTNANVTDIILDGDIEFTGAILSIPKRNITINGDDHTMNLGIYYISGQLGDGNGSLTIKDTTITNLNSDGNPVSTFFLVDNGGWSFNVENVKYTGERFLMTQRSTVNFSGDNVVDTTFENAYVAHVNFNSGTYKGSVSKEFSTFYFPVLGDGIVTINNGASVDLRTEEHTYPAFYNFVAQINIESGGSLSVVSNGPAIHAIAYEFGVQQQLRVKKGGNLYLESTGDSGSATIESMNKNFKVLLEGNYDIRNSGAEQDLFGKTGLTFYIINQALNIWPDTGGDYSTAPQYSWQNAIVAGEVTGNKIFIPEAVPEEIIPAFPIEKIGRMSSLNSPEQDYDLVVNDYTIGDENISGSYGADIAEINLYIDDELIKTAEMSDGKFEILGLAGFILPDSKVQVIGKNRNGEVVNTIDVKVINNGYYDLTVDSYIEGTNTITGTYGEGITYVRLVVNDKVVRDARKNDDGTYSFSNVNNLFTKDDDVKIVGTLPNYDPVASVPLEITPNSQLLTINPYTIGDTSITGNTTSSEISKVYISINGAIINYGFTVNRDGSFEIYGLGESVIKAGDVVKVIGRDANENDIATVTVPFA